VYYAAKAFLTTGFCRIIEEEGLGLDVVSWGELHTALSSGFPAENILMHGNAKTGEDLKMALEAGVGRIVIDNMEEIERLSALAGKLKKTARVLVRVTPGVKPSTHRYVQTGQQDSKFGFNLEGGAAEKAVEKVVAASGLELTGIHCHIGSQIFALQPFVRPGADRDPLSHRVADLRPAAVSHRRPGDDGVLRPRAERSQRSHLGA
jgi:diaminopimelate decarboxylase